jgi:hypothetical protein
MNRCDRILAACAVCAAACVGAAAVAAHQPTGAEFRYGARVDVASFAYRRDVSAGGPGLAEIPLDAAVLAHTQPDFADLRIVSSDGRQLPYLVREQTEPLSLPLPPLEKDPTPFAARHPSPSHSSGGAEAALSTISRYAVRLPYSHLPAMRLVLATPSRVFERQIWVDAGPGEREDRPDADWTVVATCWWSHADPDTETPVLDLEIPPVRGATLHLAVDEGDNAPLPLARPIVLLPDYRVRFVRPDAAPLQMLYGNHQMDAPRYDLALVARRLLDSPAAQVTAGPERPAAAPRVPPGIFFWSALTLAVVVLVALIVRLVRKSATND